MTPFITNTGRVQLKPLSIGSLLVTAALLAGCEQSNRPAVAPPKSQERAEQPAPPNALELVFAYGSEKEKWIQEATEEFNKGKHKTPGGKTIFVRPKAMGSGESIEEILSGRLKAHLTSPASAAFVVLGNAESRAKTGKDLVGSTESLVLSPVVIAMWKPMAEALGWGQKPIGWSDILSLARNPEGWAALGHPEWGKFKFGHTHPDYSNSGLIALFAEVYAAVGKVKGLTRADLEDPKVGPYLGDIEHAVVHYGSSTGFFGTKMFGNGPQYLSAAVLYENMVTEAYHPQHSLPFPVVAVYPKEGTFWSDHPVGVVERDWVTDEHRDAAKAYIKHLFDRRRQERAIAYGFRPADPQVPLAPPLDAAHGVDPKEPKTTLEVPSPEIIDAIRKLWHAHKKHSHITLVFDTSGSMSQENRMTNARIGALELVSLLGDEDELSLLPFDHQIKWAVQDVPMKTGRESVKQRIQGLFPTGGTALYDAINTAYRHLQRNSRPDRISAIVVLTDGADTNSKLKLDALLKQIQLDPERSPIRIFTIGYSADAQRDVLKKIADATQARFYVGTPQNIREVFKEISTFF
jgi:Ca-activated chloride channel family protein